MQVTKYEIRRNAGRHICLEIRVIEAMVQHCAFCKLKVLCATTLARMEGNIYFLFRAEVRPCVSLTTTHRRSRAFVFVYRLDCCSRDKMPAGEKSMKWSFAGSHHGSSFNDRIKRQERRIGKNHGAQIELNPFIFKFP